MKSILRISDAASIGMHALAFIASKSGGAVTAKDITASLRVSPNHLSKVLQRLVKVGILASVKGPKGGFSLSKPAASVTFLDIFEAIDGPIECGCCLFGIKICDRSECIMGGFLQDMTARAKKFFKSKRLSEFADFKTRSGLKTPAFKSGQKK